MVISADEARSSDATSPKGIRRDVPVIPSQEKKKKRERKLVVQSTSLQSCREDSASKAYIQRCRWIRAYVTLLRISRLLGYAEPWTLLHNETRYHSTCLHACNYLRIRSISIGLSLLTSSTLDFMFLFFFFFSFAGEIENSHFLFLLRFYILVLFSVYRIFSVFVSIYRYLTYFSVFIFMHHCVPTIYIFCSYHYPHVFLYSILLQFFVIYLCVTLLILFHSRVIFMYLCTIVIFIYLCISQLLFLFHITKTGNSWIFSYRRCTTFWFNQNVKHIHTLHKSL